jgi:hypothetical protein
VLMRGYLLMSSGGGCIVPEGGVLVSGAGSVGILPKWEVDMVSHGVGWGVSLFVAVVERGLICRS